jgi:hypothetical protein
MNTTASLLLGIATTLAVNLPARSERCLEIEGICRELAPSVDGILGVWNFKAAIGPNGFAYSIEAVGETTPRTVLGGENGMVAAITRSNPSDPGPRGYASRANSVPVTGQGPGDLLYALFGNYSGQLNPDIQLPLVSMLAQYSTVPAEGVRQAWSFDPTYPYSAKSMTAHVLPGPTMPKDHNTGMYPDGWKCGEIKVIQRDSRWNIATLVEATWSVPHRFSTQPQTPQQVEPWVVVRLEVTRISEGERNTYLPPVEKLLPVEDQRAVFPDGEFSQYYLKPGDRWPVSEEGPEFARRQREALVMYQEVQQVQRRPLVAAATTLAASGVLLFLVIRFTRSSNAIHINPTTDRNIT